MHIKESDTCVTQHVTLIVRFKCTLYIVPEFELVWVSCFSDESAGRHCSFRAQGKDFKLRLRNEPSLSFPSILELTSNTTHSVLKRRDNKCCQQLDILKPEDGRSFLSTCDGKLVSLSTFSNEFSLENSLERV